MPYMSLESGLQCVIYSCAKSLFSLQNTTKSYDYFDRVIISTVNFPAFACDRECHADVSISVKSSGVVKTAYSRSGNFMPQSHSKLTFRVYLIITQS